MQNVAIDEFKFITQLPMSKSHRGVILGIDAFALR
jgi:hypothetical protein